MDGDVESCEGFHPRNEEESNPEHDADAEEYFLRGLEGKELRNRLKPKMRLWPALAGSFRASKIVNTHRSPARGPVFTLCAAMRMRADGVCPSHRQCLSFGSQASVSPQKRQRRSALTRQARRHARMQTPYFLLQLLAY